MQPTGPQAFNNPLFFSSLNRLMWTENMLGPGAPFLFIGKPPPNGLVGLWSSCVRPLCYFLLPNF